MHLFPELSFRGNAMATLRLSNAGYEFELATVVKNFNSFTFLSLEPGFKLPPRDNKSTNESLRPRALALAGTILSPKTFMIVYGPCCNQSVDQSMYIIAGNLAQALKPDFLQ